MYCKSCGEQLNENQEICLKCGVKVGNGDSFCPHCGQPTVQGAEVCLNCGCNIKNTANNNNNYLNGQDKITMALLCFFLGSIGIHNFMMGESKKGIFKIVMCLCFGISYIFAIIDLVKILTDKYVVDPQKLI